MWEDETLGYSSTNTNAPGTLTSLKHSRETHLIK